MSVIESIDESEHERRLAKMRAATDAECPDNRQTMNGWQAVQQEAARLHVLFTQLRVHPEVPEETVLRLRGRMEELLAEGRSTAEQSALFILAARMRGVGHTFMNLLSA